MKSSLLAKRIFTKPKPLCLGASSGYLVHNQPVAEICRTQNIGKVVRLREVDLLLKAVKQRTVLFSRSAGIACPKLPGTQEIYEPESLTNSWHLPAIAVKNAHIFFDNDLRANHYEYSFVLNPVRWSSGALFVDVSFIRGINGNFEVKQSLSCTYTVEMLLKSTIKFLFTAIWLSPEGGTTLTREQLDSTSTCISEKGLNIFEPLSTAMLSTFDNLLTSREAQVDELHNACLDLIEKYNDQQQPWCTLNAECTIVDKPEARYAVKAFPYQLGEQHLRHMKRHRAVIALGSNIGNCRKHIEHSLLAMKQKGLEVHSTSFLYETEAMYYEDQSNFLNAVCEIETSLEPLALLDTLQQIEIELGRVRLVDKGPRTIDLDILLYDSVRFDHPRLQIPHKLMLERDFVLRPLADIIPEERLPLPHNKLSVLAHLENVELDSDRERPSSVSILSTRLPLAQPNNSTRSTHIMAILNMTPDSFSDGGKHDPSDLDAVEVIVRKFIEEGATIIDVGGQSTRPGATAVSRQEELARVRPVIERIRSMPESRNVAISVDTFYADVARAAVEAGVDIINDVSGGTLDSQMLSLVAELQVTVVLMHMRGTPENMKHFTEYPDGVVEGVAQELLQRVKDAQKAGIPRWRIILDPGIGFAKTQAQNLEILNGLDSLRQYPGLQNFPWLVGTSRKGFIGAITGVPSAADRVWGTAATVTTSVAGGADIVRVHDVTEMVQVVKMAESMYRDGKQSHKIGAASDSYHDTNALDNNTLKSARPDTEDGDEIWPLSAAFLSSLNDAKKDFARSLSHNFVADRKPSLSTAHRGPAASASIMSNIAYRSR